MIAVHRRRNPVMIVGAPVSMRAYKVGAAIRNSGLVFVSRSRTLTLRCANHRKFNGPPSLTVPSPQNTMSTCTTSAMLSIFGRAGAIPLACRMLCMYNQVLKAVQKHNTKRSWISFTHIAGRSLTWRYPHGVLFSRR